MMTSLGATRLLLCEPVDLLTIVVSGPCADPFADRQPGLRIQHSIPPQMSAL